MLLFAAPFLIFPFLITIHFFFSIFNRQFLNETFFRIIEGFYVAVCPLLFMGLRDDGFKNDCCIDNVFFSPPHRPTVYILIALCAVSYFYSTYRKKIAPPLVEIVVNSFLLIGIALNIVIAIQENDMFFFYFGYGTIILLFVLALVKNQKLLLLHLQTLESNPRDFIERTAWALLKLNTLVKFPLLLLLCLPVLVVTTAILLIFGQKPDSLIRAFTDTYHLGLSELNSECDNVNCGGHYLCSVAANGHTKIVKPRRSGERNGHIIICNRQLLVSNAFEELLQERLPFVHRKIRRAYNNVGDVIHRYYSIFNNKFVADAVYILMKPLEWFFIILLYTFDRKPENRIAIQYLSKGDRGQLKNVSK